MKYLALKELPDGTQPGTEIDLPEAQGQVLVLVEAATPVDETPPKPERTARRRYHRTDLDAEN